MLQVELVGNPPEGQSFHAFSGARLPPAKYCWHPTSTAKVWSVSAVKKETINIVNTASFDSDLMTHRTAQMSHFAQRITPPD